MFFRYICLISFLLALAYWFHILIRPEDIAQYHQLVEQSSLLKNRHPLEKEPAHQKRYAVQKDIWTQNETQHIQLFSETSELTVSENTNSLEATEILRNIQCHLSDEFYFSADEGKYIYPTHQLFYENPKGQMSSPPVYFSAKKLVWEKKENGLHLTDEVEIEEPGQFKLLADKAWIQLDDLNPTLVTVDGQVRLISTSSKTKPTYALADQLIYNPADKTLLFSAQDKVLFWQEGLSISADQVFIREDQTIEGRGNVHFSFTVEEQNSIDTFLKQYL